MVLVFHDGHIVIVINEHVSNMGKIERAILSKHVYLLEKPSSNKFIPLNSNTEHLEGFYPFFIALVVSELEVEKDAEDASLLEQGSIESNRRWCAEKFSRVLSCWRTREKR